jgi:hypothetical protein
MANGSGLLSTQGARLPHLVRGRGGLAGEIGDLREDLVGQLTALAAFTVDEFTNPPAADPDAIKLAVATVAAATTYSGTALNGVVGAGTLSPPRNVTVTTAGATPADAPASATFNGTDVNGDSISETIVVAQTATIALGVKAFAKVTSIVLPAADGVAATLAFGFGDLMGLSKPIKTRAGLTDLLREIEAGALVTTGVVTTTAAGLPNGTYLPATVADGANDYAVYYEYDASV